MDQTLIDRLSAASSAIKLLLKDEPVTIHPAVLRPLMTQSVKTCLRVFTFVDENPACSLVQIQQGTGLSESTVKGYLSVLAAADAADRESDGVTSGNPPEVGGRPHVQVTAKKPR